MKYHRGAIGWPAVIRHYLVAGAMHYLLGGTVANFRALFDQMRTPITNASWAQRIIFLTVVIVTSPIVFAMMLIMVPWRLVANRHQRQAHFSKT